MIRKLIPVLLVAALSACANTGAPRSSSASASTDSSSSSPASASDSSSGPSSVSYTHLTLPTKRIV